MPCTLITQSDVDAIEQDIIAWEGVTGVSQEKIGEDWFIDYTLSCTAQRFKFVVVNEIISLELQLVI